MTDEERSQLWAELLDGTWQQLDDFANDGVRHLVLAERSDGRGSPLSRAEAFTVEKMVRGAINKEIAYDLHASESSAATHLRRALKKLRFSRLKLCMVHAYLFDTGRFDRDTASRHPRASSRNRQLSITELTWRGRRLSVISASERNWVAGLTDAERDVAKCAAHGMSNRDIAAARQRSERTVANQLASAYRKLGITSRAELASALGTRNPAGNNE